MPAADITEVQVMFHDERRGREEYNPPMKKAEVRLTALVPEGHDGAVALAFVEKMVRDKIREMLSTSAGALATAATPAEFSPAEPGAPLAAATAGEDAPPKRTRRTAAQIAADNAAAAGQPTAGQPSPDTSSGSQASDEVMGEPTLSTAPAADEWDAGPPAAISDKELNEACGEAAGRVKDPVKVRGAIALFSPGGDAWDPTAGGKKFTVNDIPQTQRRAFLDKLKALT